MDTEFRLYTNVGFTVAFVLLASTCSHQISLKIGVVVNNVKSLTNYI